MNRTFKFKVLTIIVFCMYMFWGSFGVDLTLSHHQGADRFPFHRFFISLTAFIFLFNARQVLQVCAKNKLLIALIFYVLFSAAWANSAEGIIKNFVFLSSSLLISIMTALAFLGNREGLMRWLFWLFLLLTISSIIAATYFPNIGINTIDFGRPRWIGITSHPNGLGVQGLALIWLAVNLFFVSKSKFEKIILIIGSAAAFYVIFKADSMTSMLTAIIVIGCAVYYYLFGGMAISTKLVMFFFAMMGALFVMVFYMNSTDLTSAAMESTGRDATFTGRSTLWEKGFAAALERPILGYGFDDLEQLTRKYRIVMSHLHNGYVETLVKGGVIACMLLVFVLIKTFMQQFKMRVLCKYDFVFLNTGLVMILFHNFTETSLLRGLSVLNIFMDFVVVSTGMLSRSVKTEKS